MNNECQFALLQMITSTSEVLCNYSVFWSILLKWTKFSPLTTDFTRKGEASHNCDDESLPPSPPTNHAGETPLPARVDLPTTPQVLEE